MNFELFIAKRIIGNKAYKNSVSAPIIKIGITAIAIGMVVMLIAVATGLGLQQKIRDKITAFNGHIIIDNYDTNASDESQVPIRTNQEFYPKFAAIKNVTHIQGTARKFSVVRTEEDFEGVVVKGVGTDYNWDYFKTFLVEGRLPEFTQQLNNEILISTYLANRLHLNIGNTFQAVFAQNLQRPPRLRAFEIVGIYNSGFKTFDEKFCIVDIRHLQRLNRWDKDQVGNFEVFIDDFSTIDAIGSQVYKEIPSVLKSVTIKEQYAGIFEWIKLFDFNTAVIITLMIIVAGINMITALLVLILERTHMIGVLKALGSDNWAIRKIFIYNASYLVGLGLFWGNLIGLFLLGVQHYFKVIPLDPETYYVSEAPVYITVSDVLMLNIGTFLLCVLMLLIPSLIISKIAPVKAIRFT